jgi:DNA polymerase-3 subunit alpha
MFAILKNEGDKDARTDYLIEAKRLGLKILLPHVNESTMDFSLEDNSIRFGLSNVKFISENIANRLIENKPYKNYQDLVSKASIKGSGITSRTLQALDSIGAAAFSDNPRKGNEQEKYYEYLNIPKFDIGGIPPYIKTQVNTLDDFEQLGTFVFMAMVKSIKRGEGWSRVELVDETASVGVFHTEQTQIEPGNMYFFLVGDNRIHRYVAIDKVVNEDITDTFVNYLYASNFDIEDKYYVVDFTTYITKAKKKMAHIIISDSGKKLIRCIVFPTMYSRSLGLMRSGSVCKLEFSHGEDGTIIVKEIK